MLVAQRALGEATQVVVRGEGDALAAAVSEELSPGGAPHDADLEPALILTDGPVVGPAHLWIEGEAPQAAASGGSLEELERQAIERALAAASDNRKATAAKLGIGLRTLYEKLRRYNLR